MRKGSHTGEGSYQKVNSVVTRGSGLAQLMCQPLRAKRTIMDELSNIWIYFVLANHLYVFITTCTSKPLGQSASSIQICVAEFPTFFKCSVYFLTVIQIQK